ncbi:MAG: transposase [Bacteroidales bacterium]|nr:transposase [Bacteroidales bacterium]
MPYNPNIHNRRSIRLKGYDYSQAGLYFITICVQNRKCLFGNVIAGKMILNDAGRMIENWYFESENKYPDKKCREMIIMPNHFHCIVENIPISGGNTKPGDHTESPPQWPPPQTEYGANNKKYNATIGDATGWFKTMTTNEYIRGVKKYNWERFNKKLWQRNYWEHIIRNEAEYNRIADYIIDNPKNWDDDKLNPK